MRGSAEKYAQDDTGPPKKRSCTGDGPNLLRRRESKRRCGRREMKRSGRVVDLGLPHRLHLLNGREGTERGSQVGGRGGGRLKMRRLVGARCGGRRHRLGRRPRGRRAHPHQRQCPEQKKGDDTLQKRPIDAHGPVALIRSAVFETAQGRSVSAPPKSSADAPCTLVKCASTIQLPAPPPR